MKIATYPINEPTLISIIVIRMNKFKIRYETLYPLSYELKLSFIIEKVFIKVYDNLKSR